MEGVDRSSLASLTVAGVAAAILGACSSFGSTDDAAAVGVDSGALDSGALDGAETESGADRPDTAVPSPRYLYVFGSAAMASGVIPKAHRAEVLADGRVGPWLLAPNLERARGRVVSFVTPGAFVMAGGDDDPGPFRVATVEIALAAPDAGLGSWSPAPNLLMGRSSGAGATSPTRLYFAGGFDGVDINAGTSEIYASPIEPTGIGPWSQVGALPQPAYDHATAIVGSRFYVVGGGADVPPRSWTAPIAGDGTIGDWSDAGHVPSTVDPLVDHALVFTNGFLHAVGGRTLNNAPSRSVWLGTIASATGFISWAPNSDLPAPVGRPCVVADGSRIYVLGGFRANTVPPTGSNRVFVGSVGPSGAIAWAELDTMPDERGAFGCAIR